MATKLIHCKTYSIFNSKKLSAQVENTSYTVGVGGSKNTGTPEINYQDIVFIKDTRQIWTHGCLYGVPYNNPNISYRVDNLTITDYIESPNGEFQIKSDGYAQFKQLQTESIASDLFDGPATALTSKSIGSATNPVYFNSAGVPKACDYSLSKSVPANAIFTDSKVTSVADHYAPSANTASELSVDASSTTAATWNSTSIVTGVNLQRDAKGHVVGVTLDSVKMPANPNSDTKNTAGSSDTSSKIFLVGATTQAASATTYSHDTAYVGTDGCLYSGGSKVLTIKHNLNSTTSLGTIGTTSNLYAVGVDSNNKLGIIIPTVSNDAPGLMSETTSEALSSYSSYTSLYDVDGDVTPGSNKVNVHWKQFCDCVDYSKNDFTENIESHYVDFDIPAASKGKAGVMSAADKAKLDSIESGADSIVISKTSAGGKTTASFTVNGGTATTFDIYGITDTYNPTSASSTYSLSQLGAKNLYNAVLSKAGGDMNSDARISASGGSLYLGNANNSGWLYLQDCASQKNDTTNTYWYIKNDGNSLFQTADIKTTLTLNNSAGNYNGIIFKFGDAVGTHIYQTYDSNNDYYSLTIDGNIFIGGSGKGNLNVNGVLKAQGGNFEVLSSGAYWRSDKRFKDNISNARNLNIDSLIREFDWKDTGNHSWGFIAQELLEVLPEAVNYDEQIDRYSVNYDVAHSAAIASLSAKIEQLESRIKQLEK